VTTPFWNTLGWCEIPAKTLCEADPKFLPYLVGATATDRHVMALVALARGDNGWPPGAAAPLARSIRTEPAKKVLRSVLSHYPRGLVTLLPKLDRRILPREQYQRLLQLLDQAKAAKVLWHVARVPNHLIDTLAQLDPSFRLPGLATALVDKAELDGFLYAVKVIRRLMPKVTDRELTASLQSLRGPPSCRSGSSGGLIGLPCLSRPGEGPRTCIR
jgi:hypothetical protein